MDLGLGLIAWRRRWFVISWSLLLGWRALFAWRVVFLGVCVIAWSVNSYMMRSVCVCFVLDSSLCLRVCNDVLRGRVV